MAGKEGRLTEALSEIEVTASTVPCKPQLWPALGSTPACLPDLDLTPVLRSQFLLSHLQVLREAQEPSGPLMLSSGRCWRGAGGDHYLTSQQGGTCRTRHRPDA